jgi:hypothetical protein
MNLTLHGEEIRFHEIKESLGESLTGGLAALDIDGYGVAEISIRGTPEAPQMRGTLSLKGTRFNREGIELLNYEAALPIEFDRNGISIRDSSVRAEGLIVRDMDKDRFRYEMKNIRILIPSFGYRDSKIDSGTLRITADSVNISSQGKEYYKDDKIDLACVLEGDRHRQQIEIQEIALNTGSFKGISGEISLHLTDPLSMKTTLVYDGFDVGEIVTPFIAHHAKGEGFEVSGIGSLKSEFSVTLPEGGSPDLSGRAVITLAEGAFSSSDATLMGEGISINSSHNFALSFQQGEMSFMTEIDASGFELLLGSFYGNFADRVISLAVRGRYSLSQDTLTLSQADLHLTDTGSVRVSGKISNATKSPRIEADILMANISNRHVYDLLIRETFQESIAILSRLEVTGKTSLDISMKGSDGSFHARGDLDIRNMNISEKDLDRAIRGINISVPFDLSYPEVTSRQREDRYGSLSVRSVAWGPLELNNIKAVPSLLDNSLTFKEDIALPLFGGEVRIRNINYRNIMSQERNLTLSIEIDNVDLAEMSDTLGMTIFKGNLSGTIPRVSLGDGKLLTEGEIVLKSFGGAVRVGDLSVEHVFGPVPSLKSSIDIREIDLGKISETFDFGHISGILQGSVKDLVITEGQAERFKASFETVKRKGISQKISVKALKKISILGSGSSASILDRGIYRLFKEYRYEKIGFKAFLKNDNLRILGIESREGIGYLVKGSLIPPKVDVINYTQKISFQELVKRLKRIKYVERDKMKVQ